MRFWTFFFSRGRWRELAVSGACLIGIIVADFGFGAPTVGLVLVAFSLGTNLGSVLAYSRGMDRGIAMVYDAHEEAQASIRKRRERAPLN